MNRHKRHLSTLLLILVILTATLSSPALAQEPADPVVADPVVALMARLTPEEKIGQLFLTTFDGANAAPDTDIGKLIREQYIGGVVLLTVSENFTNNPDTPRQVASLANELQTGAVETGAGVPLFVAIDHEGDGFPYSRLTGGMTPIPNPMAIGATWDTANAEAVGEIVGRELAAVGVNLLLGPDVDVLNAPRPQGRGDIGTRTFGGDPWWVAQMGRAYICGVHGGSQGRVATVAKHFPGHGGSDRLPDKEVATVDKSLTELKRIELPPFFAVTGAQGEEDCAVTDAMMTSHIRYRGLQGNIRQFTAPISFDADGMRSILGLPEFAGWRQTGMMVSDALGVSAVAKYFDPTEKTFPHRQIAKEALMAGNDLLIISEFSRPRAAALQRANLKDTVTYFREEYDANPLFRQRVENAAAHVLRVKLNLYGGDFNAERVTVQADAAMKTAGQGGVTVSKIAREALTLLAPPDAALTEPPRRDEDILIFTDAQPASDCVGPGCAPYEPLPLTAVQDAITRLYGPAGSGQIDPDRIHSVSFVDLKAYLERRLAGEDTSAATPEPPATDAPDIAALLTDAEWVVFAMRNADRDANSDAVRLFLDNGASQIYKVKLAVLAFNAPYYLDTTEINKLSLYVAAYSKVSPFVEAAVRALFGEFAPAGHSPVDVEGINYYLPRQLAPDPARPIALALLDPAPGQTLLAPVTVRVQAGPLVDRNGNRVPDGTEVTIEAAYEAGSPFVPAATAGVVNGMAEATFALRQPGSVLITARSGDAIQANTLRLMLDAPPTGTPSATPTARPPTETATSTRIALPSPAPAGTIPMPDIGSTVQTPPPTPSVVPAPTGAEGRPGPGGRIGLVLLALVGAGAAGLVGYFLLQMRQLSVARRVRGWLLCLSGGMAGYIAYLLLLPSWWAWPAVAAGGAFIGGLTVMGGARRLIDLRH